MYLSSDLTYKIKLMILQKYSGKNREKKLYQRQ